MPTARLRTDRVVTFQASDSKVFKGLIVVGAEVLAAVIGSAAAAVVLEGIGSGAVEALAAAALVDSAVAAGADGNN